MSKKISRRLRAAPMSQLRSFEKKKLKLRSSNSTPLLADMAEHGVAISADEIREN